MDLNAEAAYLALKARDARFDGRLFVGVTSTGVYCRPVCRVRTPKFANCRFFDTRAQAEAAAFRPCMKCRPEIAPGYSHTDSSRTLADEAARLIEHAVHHAQPLTLPGVAARLGVTDRHLRRIFRQTHGVAPLNYITTQRLLLAKQLLTDTPQAITQVALACGFGSLRRFNAAFAERYRFKPTQLRPTRAAPDGVGVGVGVGVAVGVGVGVGDHPGSRVARGSNLPSKTPLPGPLRLAYRPPYDIEAVLGFFARREVRGVEQVDATEALSLRRTMGWTHQGTRFNGWLEMRFMPDRHEVHVTTSDSLHPVLGQVLQRVRQALDLDADPARIDPVMKRLPLPSRPGARLPAGMDGFEVALRVIMGQQVTVKAARTLVQRLVDRYGEPISTPFPALTRVFPCAETIASADPETIGKLGIVRQRVKALQAVAAAMVRGDIALDRSAPLQATLQALQALPGIGPWTAQVIALRALAWPDAWPASDIGLMNALGSRDPKVITVQAEAWRPWRAYAVLQLWHHLETQT